MKFLYLDTPVKRYSSGMYGRLGFAVADGKDFVNEEEVGVAVGGA